MPPKLHKQPKPPRKPMKRRGKKTEAWEKVRRALKPRFEKVGITQCEIRIAGCWMDNGLGFAHAKKRRNLGPGELSIVALSCNHCHDIIEALPEEDMGRIVMQKIKERKSQP